MDAFNILRSRVDWTRSWLTTHRAESIDGDFEIVDHPDSHSHKDVISLSSDDPATSCSESARTSCHLTSLDAGPIAHRRPARPASLTSHDYHDWYECTTCNPWSDADTFGYWHENQLAYASAGRAFDNNFKDLRSPSKARNRDRKHRHKYHGHRFVKPGQLNQPHLETMGAAKLDYTVRLPNEAEIVIMNKHLLYTEAQKYPRPPTYHRRPKFKDHARWACPTRNRTKLQKQAHVDHEIVLKDQQDIEADEETIAIHGFDYALDMPVFHNDRWRAFKRSDWCEVCNLHWSRCYALDVFEVDQIEQLSFEPDVSSKAGWRLRWEPGGRMADAGFGANRGDAVLLYGKLDWDPRENEEWFDDRDETDEDVRRARGWK